MAKRESTIKLIQNNTNKIISIKIEQDEPYISSGGYSMFQLKPDTKSVYIRDLEGNNVIDWGDNLKDTIGNAKQDIIGHTYNSTSNVPRSVTINGGFSRDAQSQPLVSPDVLIAVGHLGFVCGSLAGLFKDCVNLTTFMGIFDPELLNDYHGGESVKDCFSGCVALKRTFPTIFDTCRELTNFRDCFNGCSAWTGESPYTTVNGKKIKLWERSRENGFAKPTIYDGCFRGCTNLSDYNSIPDSWK